VSLVHNERVKLVATALSNIGVATVVTAIIAPIVGFLYGSPTAAASRWWWLIAVAWFVAGVGLHVIAQAVLGRLKP
jgi:hypothetical protein